MGLNGTSIDMIVSESVKLIWNLDDGVVTIPLLNGSDHFSGPFDVTIGDVYGGIQSLVISAACEGESLNVGDVFGALTLAGFSTVAAGCPVDCANNPLLPFCTKAPSSTPPPSSSMQPSTSCHPSLSPLPSSSALPSSEQPSASAQPSLSWPPCSSDAAVSPVQCPEKTCAQQNECVSFSIDKTVPTSECKLRSDKCDYLWTICLTVDRTSPCCRRKHDDVDGNSQICFGGNCIFYEKLKTTDNSTHAASNLKLCQTVTPGVEVEWFLVSGLE